MEVLSVLRGFVLGDTLDTPPADQARDDHFAFEVARYEIRPLADRIWQLRHQFNAYDTSYVALAEALDVPLFTCDRQLTVGGHEARVVLLTPTVT